MKYVLTATDGEDTIFVISTHDQGLAGAEAENYKDAFDQLNVANPFFIKGVEDLSNVSLMQVPDDNVENLIGYIKSADEENYFGCSVMVGKQTQLDGFLINPDKLAEIALISKSYKDITAQ